MSLASSCKIGELRTENRGGGSPATAAHATRTAETAGATSTTVGAEHSGRTTGTADAASAARRAVTTGTGGRGEGDNRKLAGAALGDVDGAGRVDRGALRPGTAATDSDLVGDGVARGVRSRQLFCGQIVGLNVGTDTTSRREKSGRQIIVVDSRTISGATPIPIYELRPKGVPELSPRGDAFRRRAI